MTLNTVTLQWDLADLTESGLPATLSILPTAQLSDTTDHIVVSGVTPRTVSFSGGSGQLAGIVANDDSQITPTGTGYLIEVVASDGQVIVPQFQTQILYANGALQYLDELVEVPEVTTSYQYVPLTGGTMTGPLVAPDVVTTPGPLTPFRAALANRQNATCNIVCLGDSITEGQHATGPTGPASTPGFDNKWVSRLRDMLRARYPTPGLTGGGRGFIGCTSTGETSFTWPTTKNGSPSIVNAGPKGGDGSHSAAYQLNTSGQSFVFSLNGDSATILWTQVAFGGTFSYQVDSGTATNVSTNGSGTADGKTTHISLGSAGAHTLTLAWVSGNATVDGVIEYNGDASAGIQTHDCGHFGWTTASWVTALNSGAASGPAAAIAALKPGLIIIWLGTNDQADAITPAQFQSNLLTNWADLKTQLTAPYPSVVLVAQPPREGQSGYTYPWAQYTAAMYAVAAADTSSPSGTSLISVCDFTAGPRMPGADTDAYGFWQSGDNVHLSDLGHQAAADWLLAFLAGG